MYELKQIDDLNYKMFGSPVIDKGHKQAFFEYGGGFDTESTTIKHTDDRGNVIIDNCFLYCYQFSIGSNIWILRTETEFLSFMQKLIKEVKTAQHIYRCKSLRMLLFVANMSHEYAFLKNYFVSLGITEFFCKDKRNVLRVGLDKAVLFAECIGLFGTSLSNIAKTYCNTQKLAGDLDYNLVRTPATPLTESELQYCINDVAILSELHEVALNKYTRQQKKIPLTATGEIRAGVKARIRQPMKALNAEMQKLIVSEDVHYYIRQFGYNGGLCGSNIKYIGELLHDIEPYDLTSDYPAQMNHNFYPAGELITVTDTAEMIDNLTNGTMCYTQFKIGSINAKYTHYTLSKYKIPNYDKYYKHEDCCRNVITANNKIVSGENIVFVGNEIDFRALKKMYTLKGVQILRQWKFTKKTLCTAIVRQNMNEWYKIKNELKTNGQTKTVAYTESKKQVNGHYGLTATRLYKQNYDVNKATGNIEKQPEKDWIEILKTLWLNPYIAYYTTSYAREILIDFISKYPDNIVQYDTDSMYIQHGYKYDELIAEIDKYNACIQRLNMYIFGDDFKYYHDLGQWSHDPTCIHFLPLGSKRYIKTTIDKTGEEHTETVIAGLPKTAFDNILIQRDLSVSELYNQLVQHHDKSFVIGYDECKKLTSVYDDRVSCETIAITDYLGNTAECVQSSYHALYEATFTLATAHDALMQAMRIKNENTPKKYRNEE